MPAMIAPRPESVRFVGLAPNAKAPPPPFGLERWSDAASALVVELDGSTSDLSTAGAVAPQVPECGSLPRRTLVVLLGQAGRGGGTWRRFVRMYATPVSRAARCSALLARGYVDIGAGTDEGTTRDLVWGWSP